MERIRKSPKWLSCNGNDNHITITAMGMESINAYRQLLPRHSLLNRYQWFLLGSLLRYQNKFQHYFQYHRNQWFSLYRRVQHCLDLLSSVRYLEVLAAFQYRLILSHP